jgi:hypothetical protein
MSTPPAPNHLPKEKSMLLTPSGWCLAWPRRREDHEVIELTVLIKDIASHFASLNEFQGWEAKVRHHLGHMV